MKKIILSIFTTIFFLTSNQSLAFFNFRQKYNDNLIKSLAKEKAPAEIEKFIKDIAKEMGITKNFDVYTMNSNAINAHSGANAFVVGDHVYVSPFFMKSLSEHERR